MSKPPPDKLAVWSRWRTEIALSAAALIGLASFLHELLLTENPSWLKIVASTCAIAGAPAAVALISARLGGGHP